MLGEYAGVAELLGVADQWQPAHHLQPAHLLQQAEICMAEPFMPSPSVVVPVHCETEWPGHLQLQPVHAILSPLHSGEKAMLAIPDPRYSTLNQHV
jgi:hypothetical protein